MGWQTLCIPCDRPVSRGAWAFRGYRMWFDQIPNPVDLQEFAGGITAERARFAAPNERLVVYLGKLTPRQGLEATRCATAGG